MAMEKIQKSNQIYSDLAERYKSHGPVQGQGTDLQNHKTESMDTGRDEELGPIMQPIQT